MRRPDRELSWVADGQALFAQAVMRLDDLRGPALSAPGGVPELPSWI